MLGYSALTIVMVHDELEQVARDNTAKLSSTTCGDYATTATRQSGSCKFECIHTQDASLFNFAHALRAVTQCDDEQLLCTLVLVKRYCVATRLPVTLTNLQGLYAICFLLAIKVHTEQPMKNSTFARIAGMANADVNELELRVAKGLQWVLLVVADDLEAVAADTPAWADPLRLRRRSRHAVGMKLRCLQPRISEAPSPFAGSSTSPARSSMGLASLAAATDDGWDARAQYALSHSTSPVTQKL